MYLTSISWPLIFCSKSLRGSLFDWWCKHLKVDMPECCMETGINIFSWFYTSRISVVHIPLQFCDRQTRPRFDRLFDCLDIIVCDWGIQWRCVSCIIIVHTSSLLKFCKQTFNCVLRRSFSRIEFLLKTSPGFHNHMIQAVKF